MNLTYLGSFDNVTAINSESGSNSGDVLSVDGEFKFSYFFELTGDKNKAGFQSIRYESSLENAGDDIDKVNPLNQRGEAADSISKKRKALQSLNSDIAPIQGFPEFLVWVNEARFVSEVELKSLGSGQSMYYIPLNELENPTQLSSGTKYYLEVRLEEVIMGYSKEIFGIPARIGIFDMVYQKPVLFANPDNTTGNLYNIYVPRFEAQGWQIEMLPLFEVSFFDVNTAVFFTYGQSYSGKMNWRHVTDISANTSTDESFDISVYKWKLKLELDWKSALRLEASTKIMLITLDNYNPEDNYTISLDAINTVSLVFQF